MRILGRMQGSRTSRLRQVPRAHRDDFVLHDDFLTLFPQYWASVPMGFEYVVVGQIPRHFDTGNYTVEGAAANLALASCIVTP